jgi:hypothetical protein
LALETPYLAIRAGLVTIGVRLVVLAPAGTAVVPIDPPIDIALAVAVLAIAAVDALAHDTVVGGAVRA